MVPRVQMCDRCRGIAVLGPMVENTVLLLGLSSAGMSRPGQTSDCGSCAPRGSANRDETPTLPEALPQASTDMRFSQRTYYWKGNKNTELFLFFAVKYLETLRRGGRQALVSRLARGVLKVRGSTRPPALSQGHFACLRLRGAPRQRTNPRGSTHGKTNPL